MASYSVRIRKGRVGLAICAIVLLAAGVSALSQGGKAVQVFGLFSRGPEGETEEQRLQYITDCGYTAELPAVLEEEVTIPREFDDIYEAYNDIQEQQGFNLEKQKGKKVMKYTYLAVETAEEQPVGTAAEQTGETGELLVTLLVYKGRVIGADVSSTEPGVHAGPLAA